MLSLDQPVTECWGKYGGALAFIAVDCREMMNRDGALIYPIHTGVRRTTCCPSSSLRCIFSSSVAAAAAVVL